MTLFKSKLRKRIENNIIQLVKEESHYTAKRIKAGNLPVSVVNLNNLRAIDSILLENKIKQNILKSLL